ncbi:hypothetical protein OAO87_02915 [bacterium]|nr:hypothetical protein [bacterium]
MTSSREEHAETSLTSPLCEEMQFHGVESELRALAAWAADGTLTADECATQIAQLLSRRLPIATGHNQLTRTMLSALERWRVANLVSADECAKRREEVLLHASRGGGPPSYSYEPPATSFASHNVQYPSITTELEGALLSCPLKMLAKSGFVMRRKAAADPTAQAMAAKRSHKPARALTARALPPSARRQQVTDVAPHLA